MFARRVLIMTAALSLFSERTLVAQPIEAVLQPAKPWVLDYDTNECFAERTYSGATGPVVLGIRAVPTGELFELMVARKRPGPRLADQQEGSVDFGQGPVKAQLIFYGIKQRNISIQKFRLTAEQMAAARTAAAVAVRAKEGPDTKFALRSMPAVLDGLEHCRGLLNDYWNMAGPKAQLIATPARGDVRRIFKSTDYPDEATFRDQEGSAQFLLLIDEKGAVAGCDVIRTSGIPVFEVMGCQVIRERAKFTPATDASGKPIRSSVVTPPVVWRLAS